MDVLIKAQREARLQFKIFITKWISNVVPTGIVMCERRQSLLQLPYMWWTNEDTTHILKCKDPKVQSLRVDLLKEMKCWMNSIDTHPDIITFIISGLSSWLSSSNDVHLDVTIEHDILLAFRSQLSLGWESLLLGLIAKKVIHQQQLHYSSIQSRKLGKRWRQIHREIMARYTTIMDPQK